MSGFAYQGSELELFAKATIWKQYWQRHIARYLTGDVLEVGAGIGANTAGLSGASFRHWTCLEPDGELLRQLASRIDNRYEVIQGTLADVPASTRFHSIMYIDVLEHIEHDKEELSRAASHLVDNGALIVLAPAHQSLFTEFDQAIGHFRRYNKASLRSAAPDEVTEEKVFYLDSVGMFASLANRLLLKQSAPTPQQIAVWDKLIVRASRLIDPLLFHSVGKSVVGIWRKAGPRR